MDHLRHEGEVGEPIDAPILFLAEDDVSTLQLLCEIAEDVGFEPRGFTRLTPLRDALRDAEPAMVIVDDDLPDGRGGDLVRELRADPRLGHVPSVVCTAAMDPRLAELARLAPVVSKPFDLGELELHLAEAARRSRRRGRPARRGGTLHECAPSSSRTSFRPTSTAGPASTSMS